MLGEGVNTIDSLQLADSSLHCCPVFIFSLSFCWDCSPAGPVVSMRVSSCNVLSEVAVVAAVDTTLPGLLNERKEK